MKSGDGGRGGVLRRGALFLLLLTVVSPGWPADFAPVTEAERSLTAAPSEPNAPAVVLFERGKFWMMDPANQLMSSRLQVVRRIKVLSEEGKEEYGEISVYHSRFLRLTNFEGRTVQSDGTVLPLAKDAVFKRQTSRKDKEFVTSAAFPGVEVGSILDYRYEVRFESIYWLEPWLFQKEVPTLLSEITYFIPESLGVRTWFRQVTAAGKIEREVSRDAKGRWARFWSENLPSVPDEPFGYPTEDLTTRMMLVPIEYRRLGVSYPIFKDWQAVCELVEESYTEAGRKARAAKRLAKEITAGLEGERSKALSLFRYVRDQLETELDGLVWVGEAAVDEILEARRGSAAEKSLLLQTLLEAVKIEADLVWVADRDDGLLDTELPTPWWFDRVLVRAEVDGETVFLDSADERLGFGHLAAGFEGMPALHVQKKPELITLPSTPFEENRRRAVLSLRLDDEGRISGSVQAEYRGHWAWARGTGNAGAGERQELWEERLEEEEEYEDYGVEGVEVEEDREQRLLVVSWKLTQLDEGIFGDEASLTPSRPWGPTAQLFRLPPERRRSPLRLGFPAADEVELSLSWPEGWEVDLLPEAEAVETEIGAFRSAVALAEDGRSLRYTRSREIRQQEFVNADQYGSLRNLYATVEANDAQQIVLVRD